MDLKKELKAIKNSSVTHVIHDLQKEKWELDKKMYVLRVVRLAQKLKEFVESKVINSTEITAIRFAHDYDDSSNTNRVRFALVNEDHELLCNSVTNHKYSPIYTQLYKEINGIDGLMVVETEYINSEFSMALYKYINLDNNIEEETLNLSLRKAVKTELEYNKLSVDVKETENNKATKKPKI